MNPGRVEAFSDGVIAIIITIMVLELRPPEGTSLGALKPLIPVFLSYVLSFTYVGIYWNNHHHLFQVTAKVDGAVLWANLHLLFWLSLFPFAAGWMGENHFAAVPVAVNGLIYFFTAIAYLILQSTIMRAQDDPSGLRAALGSDTKGKVSTVLYVVAIAASFLSNWITVALYVVVAIIWLIPDRRMAHLHTLQNAEKLDDGSPRL